jgi:hypothetical protein
MYLLRPCVDNLSVEYEITADFMMSSMILQEAFG